MSSTKYLLYLSCSLFLLAGAAGDGQCQEGGLQAVAADADSFVGKYRDATGQRNFEIKSVGAGEFTIACEDWEGRLIWGKNMGGCAGTFRFVDRPSVETNPTFQPGGDFENAVGFVQLRLLNNGAYELKFRWWLDDVAESWYYQIEKL